MSERFANHQWRSTPIPNIDSFYELKNQGISSPIDSKSDLFDDILVDIKDFGIAGTNHYHNLWNPPYYQSIPGAIPGILVRKKVAEMLQEINRSLNYLGLELYVFDGWRPQRVQRYFSRKWFPDFLKKKHPDKDEKWIADEVEKYWAPGAASLKELLEKIPPHSTGGATDLTLRHVESGFLLEMGSLFDDVTSVSNLDYFEKKISTDYQPGFSENEALKNRRYLYHLMTSYGFSFNPTEWWHFSYGDEMWAVFLEKPSAFYGYAGEMTGEKL